MVLVVSVVGCNSDGTASPPTKDTEKTNKIGGVQPSRFDCASIAPQADLDQLLGASARKLDSPASVPDGVAKPCTYEVGTQPPEYWTFDIDCRASMKRTADALFAQYKRTSAELIEQYNGVSDAGIKDVKPDDAGVRPSRVPEPAVEVAVGAKGLDHHGQGLIFIDDDAPCYVRIVGPDAPRRLELAKMIAKNLTFANAPMSPRAMP
ncbi:MAG: hypothetical protein AB7O24_23805 [Kofleriaceae bacterium]